MTPYRIRLVGFLGYVDQTVEFPGHVIGITGPVGSGKTSIIEGLTWAIWGEHRADTLDELVHDGAERAMVSVDFHTDAGEVTITRERYRGRNGTLSLVRDGTTLTGHTTDETQRAIDAMVGMTYEEALAGPLMIQSGAGSFMDLAPKDRKSLLFRWVVDVAHWQGREERARQMVKDATERITRSRGALDALGDPVDVIALQTALVGIEDDLTRAKAALLEARDARDKAAAAYRSLEDAKKRADQADRDLAAARTEFAAAREAHARVEEQSRLLAASMVDIDARRPEEGPTDEDHADLERVTVEASAAQTAASQAWHHARAALAAMVNVTDVRCPECGAVFKPGIPRDDLAAAQQAVADTEAEVHRLNGILRRALETEQASDALRRAYAEWKSQRDLIAAKAMGIAEAVEAAKARLAAASERGKAALAEQRRYDGLSEVDDFGEALRKAEAAVREADGTVTERTYAKGRVEDMVLRATEDNARIEAARTAIVADEEVVRVHRVLADAFGRDGIPTMLLEAALPRFEVAANEVLSRMPGGLSIRVVTQKATQAGTARERVDVVVMTDSGTERSYRMLSGGQKFRVDMALRMALTSLRDHALSVLVIDEGLDRFQDPEGREAMMEGLFTAKDHFRPILVVSHNPDVYTRLPERIATEMVDGASIVTIG